MNAFAQQTVERTTLLRTTVLAWLLLVASAALGNELAGRVVGVLDGDTLDILTAEKKQFRIRLAGIDAPEKRQAFGNIAKEALSNAVFGKAVTVEWNKTDRYGRLVGRVTANGVDVNLAMVKQGLAWHYKAYAREQAPRDQIAYAAAEDLARANHLGLWRDRNPTPPWEGRHPSASARASGTRERPAVN